MKLGKRQSINVVIPKESPHTTQHDKAKQMFYEKENEQMRLYLKNLEKTILINKELINNLCNNDSSSNIIQKLNQENLLLIDEVKSLKYEIEKMQSQILLNDQVIQHYTKKDEELTLEFAKKISEVYEKLGKKESENQENIQKIKLLETKLLKMNVYEEELKKYSKLSKLNQTEEMSNIDIQKKLVEANKRIDELQGIIDTYSSTGDSRKNNKEKNVKNLKIPLIDLGKLKSKKQTIDYAYVHNLENLMNCQADRIKEITKNYKIAQNTIKLYHTINNNLMKIINGICTKYSEKQNEKFDLNSAKISSNGNDQSKKAEKELQSEKDRIVGGNINILDIEPELTNPFNVMIEKAKKYYEKIKKIFDEYEPQIKIDEENENELIDKSFDLNLSKDKDNNELIPGSKDADSENKSNQTPKEPRKNNKEDENFKGNINEKK